MRTSFVVACLGLALASRSAAPPTAPRSELPAVRPNPNTEGAGVLHDGVLTVALEAKESAWIGPFQPIRFDLLSRDIVVVSWVNAFTVIDTGGHTRPERIAANTYVWVRRGGAWRILAAHESTRLANDSTR